MLETIRDLAVIILAIESIVTIGIIGLIAWKVYRLVGVAKSKTEELAAVGKTLMESAVQTANTAGQTATTMKGSAEFVSDTMVTPVVQVVSAVAGARGFVSALFRLPTSSPKDGGRT